MIQLTKPDRLRFGAEIAALISALCALANLLLQLKR
jgi:hypothetical protein